VHRGENQKADNSVGRICHFALAGYGVLMVGWTTKLVNDIRARRKEATTVGIVIANDRSNHTQTCAFGPIHLGGVEMVESRCGAVV
jgi:hypothetical protein